MIQTGHFGKGHMKDSCDQRRGRYYVLQQCLRDRGIQWNIDWLNDNASEDQEGHDSLYLPDIQAQLINAAPDKLTPDMFRQYRLTQAELAQIQAAPPLGTDWRPVPPADTARLRTHPSPILHSSNQTLFQSYTL